MIGEPERARLGELAMRAFDEIAERYGGVEGARIEDAVLLWEVSMPDAERRGGIAQVYATAVLSEFGRGEDDED